MSSVFTNFSLEKLLSHEATDMDIVKKIAGYMLCFYCTQTHMKLTI